MTDNPEPPHPRVAVISLATDEVSAIRDVTFPNHRDYCRMHGYAHVAGTETLAPERPPAWSKVLLIERHLAQHEWCLWIDADAMFTNLDLPLDGLLDEPVDLAIARDVNGINAGIFAIRNTPAAASFLRRVWAETQFLNHPWWEQAAMMHLIAEGLAGISIRYVEKRAINSTPDDWAPGDLTFHVPGWPDKLALLREASARIPPARDSVFA